MLTKKDLNNLRKELKEDLENTIAQIMGSIVKFVATKEDIKEFKEEVGTEFKEVKRQINDLKADLPTPQEFSAHDKRISKLESAVSPS